MRHSKGVTRMSEISVIGNAVVGSVRSQEPTTKAAPTKKTVEVDASNPTSDRVEVSEHAQLLEKIHKLPGIRQEKVDEIKKAIANNSYLTDEKLDIAFDRLINEIAD